MHRVTIITVSYNSSEIIERMLESLPASTPCIIVDNGSNDIDDLRRVSSRFNTQLIENNSNYGFGKACNIGAEYASTEFLLFLNPDAWLESGALDVMVLTADKNLDVVAFNPKIVDAFGRQKIKRKSHLTSRRHWLKRGEVSEEVDLPFLHGSALFVRTASFRSIDGFDEKIFLFYEDDDLTIRLNRLSGKLGFIPNALVFHEGEASSGGDIKIRLFKAWHYGYARYYAMRKFERPFAGVRCGLEPIFSIFRLRNFSEPIRMRLKLANIRGSVAAMRGQSLQSCPFQV